MKILYKTPLKDREKQEKAASSSERFQHLISQDFTSPIAQFIVQIQL
jgi:hypothetical protein